MSPVTVVFPLRVGKGGSFRVFRGDCFGAGYAAGVFPPRAWFVPPLFCCCLLFLLVGWCFCGVCPGRGGVAPWAARGVWYWCILFCLCWFVLGVSLRGRRCAVDGAVVLVVLILLAVSGRGFGAVILLDDSP